MMDKFQELLGSDCNNTIVRGVWNWTTQFVTASIVFFRDSAPSCLTYAGSTEFVLNVTVVIVVGGWVLHAGLIYRTELS